MKLTALKKQVEQSKRDTRIQSDQELARIQADVFEKRGNHNWQSCRKRKEQQLAQQMATMTTNAQLRTAGLERIEVVVRNYLEQPACNGFNEDWQPKAEPRLS